GSLLTLPILIFLGLPTAVANGTNRIALIAQCVFAVAGFKKKGVSNFKLSLLLSLPAILGAALGSLIAVDISDILFKRVLAIIMLLVLGIILWNSRQRQTQSPAENHQISDGNPGSLGRKHLITTMIAFFFIGIYGGFIQVGVGFIIIAALTMITRLNLVETNSHKVFIVGVYLVFSLIVFVLNDKVCWDIGLCLAAGMGLGGWMGSHWAVTGDERWLRTAITICVVAMVIKLFA
ncbi:MAG: sulfite exporter TauE/SafE family protein, partial [Candidatus Scalindua sp.]